MERTARVVLAVLLVLSVPVGVAAAETRTGGTVVVEADETVGEELTVFAGNLVVRGTVDGDVTAFAGNVQVTGQVNGDLEAFGGNVRVAGDVTGDVSAAGGNVFVEEGATVGGNVEASGGVVGVDGTVEGTVRAAAETVRVGPTADIGGDLEYDAAELDVADGARIAGEQRAVEGVGDAPVFTAPALPAWAGSVYGFLVNLVVGAVLLLVAPTFAGRVAGAARRSPLRAAGVGLLVVLGVPILLLLVALTIVGIPISLVGGLLFGLFVWVGFVYGAYAVGAWLYSLAESSGNRWAALVVGLVAVTVAGLVPVAGGVVTFLVTLLGVGALATSLWARYRGEPGPERPTGEGGEAGGERPAEPGDGGEPGTGEPAGE